MQVAQMGVILIDAKFKRKKKLINFTYGLPVFSSNTLYASWREPPDM
jgi:hypothetical protein